MQLTEAPLARPLPSWNFMSESLRATILLGQRELRIVSRTPAYLIPNALVPIFFYFVMVGSLETFAARSGVENWKAFQVPVGIMFAVQSGSAGLNMVADIESGYFDKLILTPANRLAILVGAMSADFFRIMAQAALVLAVALPTGLTFATGVPGMIVLLIVTSFWGLAFSAIGFAIALKTGNSQATQSVWTLFIPFMFLTTAFAPLEALSGWLKVAATLNPMTYVLGGMRSLTMEGWDTGALMEAIAAVALFGVVTLTFALMALRGRVR